MPFQSRAPVAFCLLALTATLAACGWTHGSREACLSDATTNNLPSKTASQLWKLVDHYRMCSWEHDANGEARVLSELIRRQDARAIYELGLEEKYNPKARPGDGDRLVREAAVLGYAPAKEEIRNSR